MTIKVPLTTPKASMEVGARSEATIAKSYSQMIDFKTVRIALCTLSPSLATRSEAIFQKDSSRLKSIGTPTNLYTFREIDKAQFSTLSKLIDLSEFKRMKPRAPKDLVNRIYQPISIDRKPFIVKKWVSPYDNFKEKKK